MAKRIITDIVAAHAVAICRRGANPQAHVLLRKSADTPAPSSTEEPNMTIKTLLAFNALSSVAKAYVAELAKTDQDAANAFLEKSEADQTTELEKAGKKPPFEKEDDEAKKTAAAAAAALATNAGAGGEGDVNKSGGITAEDITKAVAAAIGPIAAELQTLKSANAETELRKAALDPAYAGYPGGADKIYETLKSIEGQPEAVRTVVIESMKTQAEIGKRMVGFGGLHVVTDGAPSAAGDIEKKVEELQKADPKMSKEAATMKALGDDTLLMKALEEEDRMAG